MYKKFKKLDIDDNVISRIQDNVDAAINLLPSTEIIQGRLVNNISLVAGVPLSVSHKLSRNYVGWLIVRKNAQSDVWETPSSTPQLSINLTSSQNVTISLWVF